MVRHFRDSTPAEYKSFLASDVEFGADADEIVFSEQVASLPIVGAYLNKLLRQPESLNVVVSANSRDPILQYLLLLPIPRFAEEDSLSRAIAVCWNWANDSHLEGSLGIHRVGVGFCSTSGSRVA
jgi:hypothetical protein